MCFIQFFIHSSKKGNYSILPLKVLTGNTDPQVMPNIHFALLENYNKLSQNIWLSVNWLSLVMTSYHKKQSIGKLSQIQSHLLNWGQEDGGF